MGAAVRFESRLTQQGKIPLARDFCFSGMAQPHAGGRSLQTQQLIARTRKTKKGRRWLQLSVPLASSGVLMPTSNGGANNADANNAGASGGGANHNDDGASPNAGDASPSDAGANPSGGGPSRDDGRVPTAPLRA